ncbi:septum formation family protein [Nocardiopsis valliformis]|uniref:septum formation family protein n=1 Tax=Nocardiopsis valliformis TaxID=239974 RepID=UPI00034C3DB0|nr:septum formation family protein [Nocardiopsis valliformis]
MSSPTPALLSPALRNTSLALLAAGAAVSLSACGLVNAFLGTGNAMDVEVGDCFNEEEMFAVPGGENEEVSDVPLIDCAEPHNAEFFYAEDLPDGDFPGDTSVRRSAEEICEGSALDDFLGENVTESDIFIGSLQPNVETWDLLDDREILCYVVVDGDPVTGSLGVANP